MHELWLPPAGFADCCVREPEQLLLFELVDFAIEALGTGSGAAGASTMFSGDRARLGRERRNMVDAAHRPHPSGTAASAADASRERIDLPGDGASELVPAVPPLLAYIERDGALVG